MATTSKKMMSRIRTTIETVFYGNNVKHIKSIQQAYNLASNSSGTIVTDMPIYNAVDLGLERNAKVLLFNDGSVTGRCAEARKIIGQNGLSQDDMAPLIREAVYDSRDKTLYHGEVVVGLDKNFMVKAHLLIPEGHENILYNWMMNFQIMTDEIKLDYLKSIGLKDEGDIFIFSNPDWCDVNHPYGLTLFDPEHNCSALLGMKYFGEHKKGTLTLAWNIANRNNFISCHGGQKRYTRKDGSEFVAGIFGLSGSGKSTLTHYKHDNKYEVKILHDDAFVISTENGSSVALEPSYFDKTQDYPMGCEDNKFLVTAQNCGATMDADGACVLVTEDIRNGNGRAIKSKFWAENRVDYFGESINAVIWLMKDPVLPPVLKIKNATLAATLGATLATKRSSAEHLSKSIDQEALVIEPYANPFRTYPLKDDFSKFKQMIEKPDVSCYILNTGHFGNNKITKEITLDCLEQIVDGASNFKTWGPLKDIEYISVQNYESDWTCKEYIDQVVSSFKKRIEFLNANNEQLGDFDSLPASASESIEEQINEILKCNKFNKSA